MKTQALAVLLFTATCAFSQSRKIAMKNTLAEPEGQTTFIYEPPTGLFVPEDIQVNLSCSEIRMKSIPLEKKGSIYEFTLNLPASSKALFFSVNDSEQNMV